MKQLKVSLFVIVFLIVILVVVFSSLPKKIRRWKFQSVDTMKYSRDLSRQKLNDVSFNTTIDIQLSKIAQTGATHVAIDTPYDEEFLPVLKEWVKFARKYHLHVWFRGNWSGWEGWFDYPKIDQIAHLKKTEDFILRNPDLFQDGDIFTSCPECENGFTIALGNQQSIIDFREFLTAEYLVSDRAFKKIGKQVTANYFSMNYDVANAVMDINTTKQLGGVVVIDHYVKSPDVLAANIRDLAKKSGGQIVLGEFGVPIPDIHGTMTEKQQAAWVQNALSNISLLPEVIGINYWDNMGGSTALWNDDGTARTVVKTLTDFYSGNIIIQK